MRFHLFGGKPLFKPMVSSQSHNHGKSHYLNWRIFANEAAFRLFVIVSSSLSKVKSIVATF